MIATDVDVSEFSQLIRAEYIEMPGLSLTARQAQRLWCLDADTCRRLLNELIEANFLERTRRGTYVRRGVRSWTRGTAKIG